MLSAPALTALITLVLIIAFSTSLSSSALAASVTTTRTLSLQLFNDSACTIPAPQPAPSALLQPVPADSMRDSTFHCLVPPPYLRAAGYYSYKAQCDAWNPTANYTGAFVELWSGPSASDASNCPTNANTSALHTYIDVLDDNPQHTASSCVAISIDKTYANYSCCLVSRFVGYAHFTCNATNITTSNAAAGHARLAVSTVVVLLLTAALVAVV